MYVDGTRRQSVPLWAHFFTRLGWTLTAEQTRSPVFTAVSVPHRGYAAALAAFGAALSSPILRPTSADINRHFARLLCLPDPRCCPTTLIYLRDGRILRGEFVSAERGNPPGVRIRVQKTHSDRSGGLTYFVQEREAANVIVDENNAPVLASHGTGSALSRHTGFLHHLYTQDEIHQLYIASGLCIVIVGRLNSLRHEMTQPCFALPNTSRGADEGVLQDVIRVREFMNDSTGGRATVVPTSADPRDYDRNLSPRLAIFDGAEAFTKWSWVFSDFPALVVLSRTDTQFEEAIEQINIRRLSGAKDYCVDLHMELPKGIEAISFVRESDA